MQITSRKVKYLSLQDIKMDVKHSVNWSKSSSCGSSLLLSPVSFEDYVLNSSVQCAVFNVKILYPKLICIGKKAIHRLWLRGTIKHCFICFSFERLNFGSTLSLSQDYLFGWCRSEKSVVKVAQKWHYLACLSDLVQLYYCKLHDKGSCSRILLSCKVPAF